MISGKVYIIVITLLLLNTQINGSWASIFDYIWPNRNVRFFDSDVKNLPAVPFEVGERDEKFIFETSKLLGKKLSELDFCQQRVVLLLKNSCNSLNEEQTAKLAVMLLNCQLVAEGQDLFECTDNMLAKDCIANMNVEMREQYRMMHGRAKTVCLIIRQDQFRGIAEVTVNSLIGSAHENINLMNELKRIQNDLQRNTLNSINEITSNNLKLLEQQQDLLKIAETHQNRAEFNFKEILREKNLIKSGHAEMVASLGTLKTQLQNGLSELQDQGEQARNVYTMLVNEIAELQGAAEKIADHLVEVDDQILDRSRRTEDQFKETLAHLKEVNEIILNLSGVIRNFRDDYIEKVKWFSQHLGADEEILIKNLTAITIHVAYLLIGMLCLVFVNAEIISRFLFLLTIALNLVAVLCDFIPLNLVTFSETIFVILASKCIFNLSRKYDLKKYFEFGNDSEISINPTKSILQNFTSLSSQTSDRVKIIRKVSYDGNNNNNNSSHIGNDNGISGAASARNRRLLNDRRSATPASCIQLSNDDDQLSQRSRADTPIPNNLSYSLAGKRCTALTARGAQCQLTVVSSCHHFCRIHARPSYER